MEIWEYYNWVWDFGIFLVLLTRTLWLILSIRCCKYPHLPLLSLAQWNLKISQQMFNLLVRSFTSFVVNSKLFYCQIVQTCKYIICCLFIQPTIPSYFPFVNFISQLNPWMKLVVLWFLIKSSYVSSHVFITLTFLFHRCNSNPWRFSSLRLHLYLIFTYKKFHSTFLWILHL